MLNRLRQAPCQFETLTRLPPFRPAEFVPFWSGRTGAGHLSQCPDPPGDWTPRPSCATRTFGLAGPVSINAVPASHTRPVNREGEQSGGTSQQAGRQSGKREAGHGTIPGPRLMGQARLSPKTCSPPAGRRWSGRGCSSAAGSLTIPKGYRQC
jgi:hypothetical protein